MVLSKGVERLSEVIQVVLLLSVFDEHIIDVYFDIPPNLFLEHLVH